MNFNLLEFNKFIQEIPKIELHFHLEGAIPLPALMKLIEKYDSNNEISNLKDLELKFYYKNFSHFIDTWVWKNNFIREYEDFTYIASEVAKDLIAQNINYIESFYSPGDFTERHGLEVTEITHAIRKGFDKHSSKITVNLVTDLIRDFGPEKGKKVLDEIKELDYLGVIGIGIGGSERLYPPEPFEKIYAEARREGLKTSAHAGEAAGTNSIWGAIQTLKVDRIGHGTRAFEDPYLLDYLKEKQIPIEMCPISNLRTGVVKDIRNHPIRDYFDNGLLVTVNTDDPKMFNNSLSDEYRVLKDIFGFNMDEIIRVINNGISAAWCDNELKDKLRREISRFRTD